MAWGQDRHEDASRIMHSIVLSRLSVCSGSEALDWQGIACLGCLQRIALGRSLAAQQMPVDDRAPAVEQEQRDVAAPQHALGQRRRAALDAGLREARLQAGGVDGLEAQVRQLCQALLVVSCNMALGRVVHLSACMCLAYDRAVPCRRSGPAVIGVFGWMGRGMGEGGTRASFRLTSRLNRADLPAFGGPVMATTGSRGSSAGTGTVGSPFRLELGLTLLRLADAAVAAARTCATLLQHARAARIASSNAVRMHVVATVCRPCEC